MCTHTTNLMHLQFLAEKPQTLRLSADEKRFVKGVSQLAALSAGPEHDGKPFKGDMVHKAAWNMLHKAQLETWM
jgi:hypothetical protein